MPGNIPPSTRRRNALATSRSEKSVTNAVQSETKPELPTRKGTVNSQTSCKAAYQSVCLTPKQGPTRLSMSLLGISILLLVRW